MSSTQAAEMFQSSWMSWSSITIETETVESSQRIVRVLPRLSIQARVLLEVGDLLARRLADVAALADEGERSPARPRRRRPGRRASAGRAASCRGRRAASPRPARTGRRTRGRRDGRPWAGCTGAWWGSETRQEPKANRSGASPPSVRITLGGNSESGSGQRRSPSSATSYSVVDPGSSSSTITIPKWWPRDAEGRLVWPSTSTSHGSSVSTQIDRLGLGRRSAAGGRARASP